MTETFIALLLAHVLADFVFQNKWMISAKAGIGGLFVHGVIVVVAAWIAVGFVPSSVLVLIFATHVLIDAIKAQAGDGLWAYLLDQAAHVAVIALAAWLAPEMWSAGLWGGFDALAAILALAAGAILVSRAGGFFVEKLLALLPGTLAAETVPGAGQMIGYFERLLTFLFMLIGQPQAIAFLIAAKSILRFTTVSGDAKRSEYVVIGTLASITWAIVTALAIAALIGPDGLAKLRGFT